MQFYAIKIRKSDLDLITLLNNGVTPEIEKKETYFIFDATWNSVVPNKIVTTREFFQTYEFKTNSPMLLALKK